MRISTAGMFKQSVTAMLEQQSRLAETQQQLATGKRILNPSDDPAAASRILDLGQMIDTTRQYQRNADAAETRLRLEETALVEVSDLLQHVRELAVRANNGTASAGDRNAIAIDVRSALDGLLQFANSKDANGDYLFAGFSTGTRPFIDNGSGVFTYVGDQGSRLLQVGPGREVADSDPGDAVFLRVPDGAGGVESVFEILYSFAADLEANNPSSSTLTKLDAALDEVLKVRASIGSRMSAIDNQRDANEGFMLMIQENRSALEDLDYAEAVSRFEQQMLAMQASQQSFLRIEGLSLFNYL